MTTALSSISGRSAVFCILADPVHHVKTPQLFNAVLSNRGIDGVLVPMHIAPDALPLAFSALGRVQNLKGVVVTVPHKVAGVQFCRDLSTRAQRCGAINVARRNGDGSFSGENFDGFGFVQGLIKAGIDPRASRIFMAGAGGAAKAIAVSLGEHGFRHLTIHNRTEARAQDLCARLREFFPGAEIRSGSNVEDHDLVINATSLGLHAGDEFPLDVSCLTPTMTVAEIIMDPKETPLLSAALQRGCRVHHGLAMLEEQINLLVNFLIETAVDSRRR